MLSNLLRRDPGKNRAGIEHTYPDATLRERRKNMKEITLNDRILDMDGNPSVRTRDKVRSRGPSWAGRLVRRLITALNAPFQSDWEKKTGLKWKEWTKLRS